MMPGLHPGLLLANAPMIEFEGAPQQLYISTGGGPGNRSLGLFLSIRNGQAPYTYEWSIDAGPYSATPSAGSGTTNDAYVGFSTNVYVDGGLSDYQLVGEGYLQVTDAAGRFTSATVPVFAGQ